MRYKYNIYKHNNTIVINTANFSFTIYDYGDIEISSKIHVSTIEIKENEYILLNDIDIFFGAGIKEMLLEAIQRYLYCKENNIYKSDFGIQFGYRFKKTEERMKRISIIIEDINKKYNLDNFEYFKYDLSDKEFILKCLRYNYEIFKIIPKEMQYDKDIFKFYYNKYGYHIDVQDTILKDKIFFKLILEMGEVRRCKINKDFLDDEIINLLIEKEYSIYKY